MSSLWRHSGLARLSLSACGWLTLTGLHQPRPQLRWRLLTALSLVCLILLALAAGVRSLRGDYDIWEILVTANIFNFLLKTGAVLVKFVTRRADLRRVAARLEVLERRADPGVRSAGRLVQLQAFFFWMLAVSFFVFWIFYQQATSDEHSETFFVHMWTPESLHHSPESYAVYVFQLLVLYVCSCFMGTFDSCYFVWMKAATCHLKAARRTLQDRRQDRLNSDVEKGGGLKTGWADNQPSLVEDGWMTDSENKLSTAFSHGRLKLTVRTSDDNRVTPDNFLSSTAAAGEKLQDTDDTSDIEDIEDMDTADVSVATLQEVGRYYNDISRFVSAVNQLTGLPSFVIHASTMMNVLLDGYLLLRLLLRLDGAKTIHMLTYSLELVLFVSRLIIYSLCGDEIIQESAALRQAVVDVPWQRLTSRASQHRGELLLKLQKSLCVEPLGFFTVRKANVLSMTGLFLTYFVIIIQMVQMTGVDD